MEKHKFQYKFVEVNGFRRKFESVLDRLLSGFVNCFNVVKVEITLKAIDNDFNIYLNDVGLLTMCELHYKRREIYV